MVGKEVDFLDGEELGGNIVGVSLIGFVVGPAAGILVGDEPGDVVVGLSVIGFVVGPAVGILIGDNLGGLDAIAAFLVVEATAST